MEDGGDDVETETRTKMLNNHVPVAIHNGEREENAESQTLDPRPKSPASHQVHTPVEDA